MIDYDSIFNKLTIPTFDKFLESNNLKLSRGNNKSEYQNNLLNKFSEDSDFEKLFQDFYIQTEEAGKKHFYIYKLDTSKYSYKRIKSKTQKYKDESQRSLDPIQDNNNIFFKVDNKRITFKKIQIKKTYQFKDQNEDNGILTKRYSIINIHYITFITFDYIKNVIIYGYDSYGELSDKKLLEQEKKEFLNLFVNDYKQLESAITSTSLDNLRTLQNCLATSVSNKANIYDSAKFTKSKADLSQIEKDLKNQKYTIDSIKDNNPNFDLQTNVLYVAGIAASMNENFSMDINDSVFNYFSNKSGKISNFKIRVNVTDGCIITNSESITKKEIWDVFEQII